MPNASEEHQAQLWEPVGLADGLVVLGGGLDEVGTALGEVGRGDGEPWPRVGLGFGLFLCGGRCRGLCFTADST
ncbi:MAG: hypothetical protein ACRDOC_14270 [Streptosporangiaceae bacterium]